MWTALVLFGEYTATYSKHMYNLALGFGILFPVILTLALWWKASQDPQLKTTEYIRDGRLRQQENATVSNIKIKVV